MSQQRLYELLCQVSTTEQIAEALGIADPSTLDAEFWLGQHRGARRRFLTLILKNLDLPLELEATDLDHEEAEDAANEAEHLLADGTLRYADIRKWWHNRGQFEHAQAIFQRREQKRLAGLSLRVLVVFEGGGAKYLAYTSKLTEIRFVEKDDAYQFPVNSVSDLDKGRLKDMGLHFEALLKDPKVLAVKVLVGERTQRKI